MKNVFLILVLFGGFAMSSLSAQACKPANCAPCPPGCCIINCCKGAAAAASVENTSDAPFVLLTANSLEQPQPQTMSRKEMKACVAACKKANVTTAQPSCQPAACKPAACQPSAGQPKTALVNLAPAVTQDSSLTKG